MKLLSALNLCQFFTQVLPRSVSLHQALPLLCSEQQEALGFDGDLQELYAAIVTHGSARKRKLSEQHSAEEVEHTNKEPELVLNASGEHYSFTTALKFNGQI